MTPASAGSALTHLDGICLADGGMETTLIFHHGLDLPHFAAFTLLASDDGRGALASYYDAYLAVAEERGVPIVLDTATWRASADWGDLLGYSPEQLADANRQAVATVRAASRAGRRLPSSAAPSGRVATATSPTY